jgi:hypothetical protein
MPILDAAALDTDPNGMLFLRDVLDSGLHGRRLEFYRLIADGEPLSSERAYPLTVEIGGEFEAVPIGVLAAAAAE